ncbi:putative uncharacterized protein C8orf49 [Plecturocebus cupreus]
MMKPSLLKIQKIKWHEPVVPATWPRHENHLNLEGRGLSEPRWRHCTPTWSTKLGRAVNPVWSAVSGAISVHCKLHLPTSRTWFHHVAQADLDLLSSSGSGPPQPSKVLGLVMSHLTQFKAKVKYRIFFKTHKDDSGGYDFLERRGVCKTGRERAGAARRRPARAAGGVRATLPRASRGTGLPKPNHLRRRLSRLTCGVQFKPVGVAGIGHKSVGLLLVRPLLARDHVDVAAPGAAALIAGPLGEAVAVAVPSVRVAVAGVLAEAAVMMEEAEPQHVDQQPGHADPEDHQRLLHLMRLDEALDGLQQDGETEAGQEDGVHQSPHHLGPDPAELRRAKRSATSATTSASTSDSMWKESESIARDEVTRLTTTSSTMNMKVSASMHSSRPRFRPQHPMAAAAGPAEPGPETDAAAALAGRGGSATATPRSARVGPLGKPLRCPRGRTGPSRGQAAEPRACGSPPSAGGAAPRSSSGVGPQSRRRGPAQPQQPSHPHPGDGRGGELYSRSRGTKSRSWSRSRRVVGEGDRQLRAEKAPSI